MLTHLVPAIRVHLFVLVMQDGKVLEMSALMLTNVLPKHTHVIHIEPVPISLLYSNALVELYAGDGFTCNTRYSDDG